MKCLAYFLLFLFILQLHLSNGDSSSEDSDESDEVQETGGNNRNGNVNGGRTTTQSRRGGRNRSNDFVHLHLSNGDSSSDESDEVQQRTGNSRNDNVNGDHPCKLECKQVTNPRRRVCGSDGITYPSFCLLKAARCKGEKILFVSRGACPDPTPSETTIWTSTSSTTTSHPAVPSRFVEKCPDVCPLARQPVCGTDGTTYQSPCRLQLVACIRKDHTLVVASLGPCPVTPLTSESITLTPSNSASTQQSPIPVEDSSTPSLGANGNPIAIQHITEECPDVCPLVRQPVCGTDGTTYESPCKLQLVACVRKDHTLVVASLGPCPLMPSTSDSINPTPSNSATTQRSPIPVQVTSKPSLGPKGHPVAIQHINVECPDVCPLARQPVCGTDGTTYPSPCILQFVACVRKDHTLVVASLGPCPLPSST